MNIETADFEVGGESEIVEVTGEACGQLQQTIDGLHEAIGQFGIDVGPDAVAMAFEGLRPSAENRRTRAFVKQQLFRNFRKPKNSILKAIAAELSITPKS